jgi:hypothetical protein
MSALLPASRAVILPYNISMTCRRRPDNIFIGRWIIFLEWGREVVCLGTLGVPRRRHGGGLEEGMLIFVMAKRPYSIGPRSQNG